MSKQSINKTARVLCYNRKKAVKEMSEAIEYLKKANLMDKRQATKVMHKIIGIAFLGHGVKE